MPHWPLNDEYIHSRTSTEHIRIIKIPPVNPPLPDQYNSSIEYMSIHIENHKPMVKQTLQNLLTPVTDLDPVPFVGLLVDMFCTSMIDVANDLDIPCYLFFASPAAYLGFVLHLTTLSTTESIESSAELTVPSYAKPVPSKALPANHPLHEKTIGWLDRQPSSSVVFLCFGSMGSLTPDQVKEIAMGLERAGYRFLWANREPAKSNVELPNDYEHLDESLFPDGFMERTTEIGLVCGWVPQQQLNAFEMARELGLSVEIRLDSRDKGGDLVLAEEVERGVKELMDGGDGELRKKVKEMSEKSKKALMENGSSFRALEDFINILLSNI
ncbi:hypothetical protein L1887_07666 [Cichorium endivia]|nr:hypothetical protein L1887_07666 [Cichorium endivia]